MRRVTNNPNGRFVVPRFEARRRTPTANALYVDVVVHPSIHRDDARSRDSIRTDRVNQSNRVPKDDDDEERGWG